MSSSPTATIRKHRASNQFYEENLAENVNLRMMLISAGEFQMGSPDSELERSDSERKHLVSVSSFFMGKYPVTQAQWRAVAQMPILDRELDPDPSHFKGNMRPVEKVSLFDAIEFCSRLSQYTNREYRLPTKVEWEYACRAGTTTPFHFGETIFPELANYRGEVAYANGPTGEYRVETTPVDYFGVANDWGLCDMHGNVFEWIHVPLEEINLQEKYMLCGGAWNIDPTNCGSDSFMITNPEMRGWIMGFRVACSAPRVFRRATEPA